ncbi:hypothetical protein N9W89_08440 [Hellea sp.]|nr:hypothetical protein [Hellea sp.]
MGLLRKKLDVKSGIPDHIINNLKIWHPLHSAICAAFSELTQMAWETGRVDVKSGELKELKSALPETGLGFSYSVSDHPATLLAHYESRFAAQVTTRSLEMQAKVIDETYKPTKLDLILFRPIVQGFDIALGDLFSATFANISENLKQSERSLNLQDIELADDKGVWNEVTFIVQQSEDHTKTKLDTKKTETKKANKKAVKKTVSKPSKPLSLTFKILLPQTLLQNLLASCMNEDGPSVIDPENPWTDHMRQSLDTAVVPVRAVVETCRMTVADCTRFEIGQVIELPGVSLQSIGLETEMVEGSVNFGSAALGIYKSHRAVKLIENMNPEFCPESCLN